MSSLNLNVFKCLIYSSFIYCFNQMLVLRSADKCFECMYTVPGSLAIGMHLFSHFTECRTFGTGERGRGEKWDLSTALIC